MNQQLVSAIEEMYTVDQSARDSIGPGKTIENRMVYLVDNVHNGRLHRLIDEFGYPNEQKVGGDGLKKFWLLIQHQDGDLALQRMCLENCGFAPEQEAFLTDRVLANSGEPQIYGTQLVRNEEGVLVPKPIKDESLVDERRADVGLGPLADHIMKVSEQKK